MRALDDVSRGYSDIDSGSQVLIKDGNRKLIASGSLGKGSLAELGSDPACVFSVAVENIPSSDFYTIEIGNRKGMTYCKEEMQQKKWRLELSLG